MVRNDLETFCHLDLHPAPKAKSYKLDSIDKVRAEQKTEIRNAVLNAASHEQAETAMAEFQSLNLEDKVDNVFSVLLDLRMSISSTATTHHDHGRAISDLEVENENLNDKLTCA